MEYAIIALTVLLGAGLTFFSGFGLGTILLPVFSLFFDLPTAVGATAIVHLANNLFKFGLVYKYIHWQTLIRFGAPALIFAVIGSFLLKTFDDLEILYSYQLSSRECSVTWVKTIIGFLMIFFAWYSLSPRFKNFQINSKYLILGGALSGFFGGVSGHQGAFRAAFLSKSGLSTNQFIGTSNAVSLIVDLTRLFVYMYAFSAITGRENKFILAISEGKSLLLTGIVFAFIGTYFGKKMVKKATISSIQNIVGFLLFLMGALMIVGIL